MYLNGKQLIEICEFMGISCTLHEPSTLDTEVCIRVGDIYDGIEKPIYQDGLICYFAEYPEEGVIGLENKYIE